MTIKIFNKKPVKNLKQFLEHVAKLRREWVKSVNPFGAEEGLWYRGQQSEAWGLSPKLHRNEFKDATEEEIRQEFQSKALQLITGRIPQDKFEWYFLMQHYGAPTRLLDWTDNPLVALYFAVDEENVKKKENLKQNAAVFVLDPWWLNRRLKRGINGPMLPDWKEAERYLYDLEKAFSKNNLSTAKRPAAIEPPHVDRRLATQGSRFVIFGKIKDLRRIKAVNEKSCRLIRVVISHESRKEIRRELEHNGITESTLFPDISHLCSDISRKWRI